MASKTLILLVVLCLWEELWGGASVAKVVGRRGVHAHAPMTAEMKPVEQRDSSAKINVAPPGADALLVIHSEMAAITAVAPLPNLKTSDAENAKFAPKEQKPVSNLDLAIHTVAERSGADPDRIRAQNASNSVEPSPKREKKSKALLLRRPELSYHGNRTRFRPLVRSRVTPDLTVLTTVAQRRGRASDLTRKSNLTENHSLSKPGPKESPAQLQKHGHVGPSLLRTGRSKKQDPVSTEPGLDGAVTPGLSHSRDQTVRSDSRTATNPDSDPDWSVHTHRSLVVGVTLDSGGGGLGSEVPEGDRHYSTHTTLTMQSDRDWNAVSNALQTDLPLPPTVTLEPQGDGNQSSVRTEEPRSGVTLNSVDGRVHSDGGHVLKLRPHLDLDLGVITEMGERGVTVDSWLGSRGLVFEEAEEGRSQREAETRSRSRRSWIWNQFFVIEEYSGPEPVLIGRLHTDMDRGDGRTKYILRGEGAGSVFVIDEKTGNIHVTKPLDREEKDEYRADRHGNGPPDGASPGALLPVHHPRAGHQRQPAHLPGRALQRHRVRDGQHRYCSVAVLFWAN
ncbi:hypothetical protein SKAU_G00123190 [Synaphobranchus kaupii]|uniref:Cadherin domain-containing protein n=1 Tax=Synaphobranchus kaupii TaxID=118154 RepID=A0A9Q1FPT0_SYNKA|nr:hypothetical protein SKAU_G00123190 [Synaphobranchus kaupii]